jgi:fatty acid desaturase
MVAARLVFLAILAGGVLASGLAVPFLLFWVVPFLTWLQLVLRVRSVAEHFGIEGREGAYAGTRTTLASAFDRLFIAPRSAGYHFEHHLYPSVPLHRLAELHHRLMEVPDYRRSVHLTRGYWNVLRECAPAGP